MATYATQAEFEAYVEGWTTTNAAALERLLKRAERDIDHVLSPFLPRDDATGLKLVPADLTALERAALSRATCAQAEHRFRNPAAFTGEPAPGRVKGPDFEEDYSGTATGTAAGSRYSPQVAVELEQLAAYRLTTARARA